MGLIIKCCRYCEPPQRHPGCHGKCPLYAAEKAEHDRLKAADAEKRKVKADIYNQRAELVTKAMKRHGRN